MTTPDTAPASSRAARPRRRWDLVLSIVLLALSAAVGLILLALSPFLVMASDPCGAALDCNETQMGIGFLIGVVGPGLVVLVGIALTITLLVLRRIAFWVPLVSTVLAIAVFLLAAAIVVGGVPGSTL